jgi:hypothetical protein
MAFTLDDRPVRPLDRGRGAADGRGRDPGREPARYAGRTVAGPDGCLKPVALAIPPLDVAALFRGVEPRRTTGTGFSARFAGIR